MSDFRSNVKSNRREVDLLRGVFVEYGAYSLGAEPRVNRVIPVARGVGYLLNPMPSIDRVFESVSREEIEAYVIPQVT